MRIKVGELWVDINKEEGEVTFDRESWNKVNRENNQTFMIDIMHDFIYRLERVKDKGMEPYFELLKKNRGK